MKLNWVEGAVIKTRIDTDEIVISANRAGLISLANHLQKMAHEDVMPGYHLHFDDLNGLEEQSISLVIEKII